MRELNAVLQRALNPARPDQPVVERFGWRFQTGDKVIQTENDYDKDVFNGDVGMIERIDPVEQEIAVRFDERLVKYDFGELDDRPILRGRFRARTCSSRNWLLNRARAALQ